MRQTLLILCGVGFLVSLYAIYVRKQHAAMKKYKALCDVNYTISCSDVLTNKYGKLLWFSNATLGSVYYPVLFLLLWFGQVTAVYYLAITAALGSLYLLYLMLFRLKKLCLVCTSIYVINFVVLYLIY